MPNPFDKLYWLRVGSGLGAGFLAYSIFRLPGLDYSWGLLVGMMVYLATYYIARFSWYRKVEAANMTKLYSTGIGGYIMLFIFTWILLFTLL